MERDPPDENKKRKYFQEEVRYYVREDGKFIPVYTRQNPKAEIPEDKKVKPFNVDSYEIFKYENEYIYSSEEEYHNDSDILNEDDEESLGIIGLEERKISSRSCTSDDQTDLDNDDEYGSKEDVSEASKSEASWDVASSRQESEEEEKDPEELKELSIEELKPYAEELLVPRKRDHPKKWKPNPYCSTLIERDKITESDKEEMLAQKEVAKYRSDEIKLPTDEEIEKFVLPKHGDVDYIGEPPVPLDAPHVPLTYRDERIADLEEDDLELFPDRRDYQSDFVTDTSEEYSTVTEVDEEDLSTEPEEYPHDNIPECYLPPQQLDAGDHQYQQMPPFQPAVRTWCDWHGRDYLDMKTPQGDWVTVEEFKEEYPVPRAKHSEHYWTRKGEEHGFYPQKCSPYMYPPDEDGYYHYCPGYNHIPGTENWGFYKKVINDPFEEDIHEYPEGEGKLDELEEEEEDDDEDDEDPDKKSEKKEKTDLEQWRDYVTTSLRPNDAKTDKPLDTSQNNHKGSVIHSENLQEPWVDSESARGMRADNSRYNTECGEKEEAVLQHPHVKERLTGFMESRLSSAHTGDTSVGSRIRSNTLEGDFVSKVAEDKLNVRCGNRNFKTAVEFNGKISQRSNATISNGDNLNRPFDETYFSGLQGFKVEAVSNENVLDNRISVVLKKALKNQIIDPLII